MTKTRVFLFAALALVLASGALRQLATAANGPRIRAILRHGSGVPFGVTPEATPTAASGITAMGPINTAWPATCGTGGTGCASDPSGTMLIGAPEELWSAATCTSTTIACGQIYNFVVSNTAKGAWSVGVEVKQGTKVIYDTGLQSTGSTFAAGDIGYSSADVAFGPGDCVTGVTCVAPVAGAATITFTNKIGKVTVTGTQAITLQ